MHCSGILINHQAKSWKYHVKYLDESLYIANVILLNGSKKYLKSIDEWCMCNVHLSQSEIQLVLISYTGRRISNITVFRFSTLILPRKKGPSSNFERKLSILSRASTGDHECSICQPVRTSELQKQYTKLKDAINSCQLQ
jgi:hypothetical protein